MAKNLTHELIEKFTKPVIIEAFATWCPHCAKMRPIFDELAKKLEKVYTFTEFDVDKSTDLAEHFKITALPTFIFINNKKEIGREAGEMTKDKLIQLIEDYFES